MRQTGFALLEVLLTWAMLMMASVGLFGLLVENGRKVQQDYFEMIGSLQLQSLAERLSVKNADVMTEEILWNDQNRKMLPGGEGYLACHQRVCLITLQWKGGKIQKRTLSVVLP